MIHLKAGSIVVQLRAQCTMITSNIAQTLAIGELGERNTQELLSMQKTCFVPTLVIALNDAMEIVRGCFRIR
jgi:hypothetical protein